LKFIATILAFYIFLGGLIPNSDFSQLTRIPDMMKHYQLHQEEIADLNIKISFWEFIKIHFISPGDHEGNDGHQNCPFQSFCSSTTFIFSSLSVLFFETTVVVISGNLSYENAFYLNGFITTEIHPPSLS